ncbi:agouti-signaling protein 2b [Echeneis naucrates]|uniref:agouti-signaling protein 2b n=1 Tax=Echeneis naucrates TaxID=173247 RepID=UPI0011142CC8|nr:agouti-related protein-like [Echeneis naucrates]
MRNHGGKYWVCLLLLALQLSWAKDVEKGAEKTHNVTVWNQAKTRPLFARQKVPQSQGGHRPRHNSNTSVRHCGQLMESCSSRVPCCDPCASCRCRLFNTICQCWRLNHLCFKKT